MASKWPSQLFTRGTVEGVESIDGVTQLLVNGAGVALTDILSVRVPN